MTLRAACRIGAIEAVQRWIQSGSDVDIDRFRNGETRAAMRTGTIGAHYSRRFGVLFALDGSIPVKHG